MSSKTKKESKKISSSVSVVDNEPLVTPHTVVKTSAMVDTSEPVVEKKKRGRKKQNVVLEVGEAVVEEIIKPPPKKRGRKPKGGKIIQQTVIIDDKINNEANVILHLKCSLSDINNHDITTNYPILLDEKTISELGDLISNYRNKATHERSFNQQELEFVRSKTFEFLKMILGIRAV